MNIIKHMLTGIDGETFDPARVMWIVGLVTALAFTGYEVYNTKHFNIADFCLAYGGLLAAGAGAVKLKESTEPKA